MKAQIVIRHQHSSSEELSSTKASGTLSSSKYCMAEGCIESGDLNIVYVRPMGKKEDVFAVKLCTTHARSEGHLNLEKYCKLG